jgi:hypothetical protein
MTGMFLNSTLNLRPKAGNLRSETANANGEIVLVMDLVGSRKVALNSDLARAGVKTGPYVRKRLNRQARTAELWLESTASPGRKYYGLDDKWIGNVG